MKLNLAASICTHGRTDSLAQAMIASGVDDFDVGSLDSIPDILEHVSSLENIYVPTDFHLPIQDQDVSVGLGDVRSPPPSRNTENHKIRVHRSDLLNDTIATFKQQDIIDRNLTIEYVNKVGSDLDGVSRDVFSSFWIEFLRCSSKGED